MAKMICLNCGEEFDESHLGFNEDMQMDACPKCNSIDSFDYKEEFEKQGVI